MKSIAEVHLVHLSGSSAAFCASAQRSDSVRPVAEKPERRRGQGPLKELREALGIPTQDAAAALTPEHWPPRPASRRIRAGRKSFARHNALLPPWVRTRGLAWAIRSGRGRRRILNASTGTRSRRWPVPSTICDVDRSNVANVNVRSCALGGDWITIRDHADRAPSSDPVVQ